MTITQAMELALRHHATGQWQLAERIHRQILLLNPQFADAHMNLGIALASQARNEEAIESFKAAVAHRPDSAEGWFNLGNALYHSQKTSRAIDAFSKAVTIRHNFPEAWNNLGLAKEIEGNLPEAIAACRTAISLRADYADAHVNLARTLQAAGDISGAIDTYRKAIQLKGDLPAAHFDLATALLLSGDFESGFAEFEWRLSDLSLRLRRITTLPKWDGSPLNGRRVLLYAEQGFGDAIQMIRYLPFLTQKAGKVLLYCHPELVNLFQGLPGIEQTIAFGTAPPAADVCCPLESLPFLAQTTESTIPACNLNWESREDQRQLWKKRLASIPGRLKVGIVWAGGTIHLDDRKRSLTLKQLEPLLQLQETAWVSLQKPRQASENSPDVLHNWTDDLKDFSDTAALIMELDLVLSVDTAVAHLAGSLGKPVWVLLPFVPDWRWMMHRSDSPWYPSMRLFRQSTRGDWSDPIAQIGSALRSFSGGA